MHNEHYGIYLIILLDYICTSKDYKFNFNMNYGEYPLKKYVLKNIIKVLYTTISTQMRVVVFVSF